jgi:2,5-diketo-D-gluconate reductase A
VNRDRIRENFDLFDFELSGDEMQSIAGMNEGKRIAADPDTAAFK